MSKVSSSTSQAQPCFEDELQRRLKSLLFGRTMLGLLALIAGATTWSLAAPLQGGALASGQVIIDGDRVPIQHQEGGLLEAVLVREGDMVEQGQVLAIIKSTALLAKRNASQLNLFGLQVEAARLSAERDGASDFEISSDALDPELRGKAGEIVAEARDLLARNQSAFTAQLDSFSLQEAQARSQLQGLKAQRSSLEEQILSLEDDIAGQKILLDKGLTRLPSYRQYERQLSASRGQREFTDSEIARIESALMEIRSNREAKIAERSQAIVGQLGEARESLIQATEELFYLDDAFARSEVKSPVRGQILNVSHDAPGSVIAAGGQLMEVVPPDPSLVIEAHVAPRDVESLHAGNKAVLTFPGFSRREMPRISGRLISISDDVIADPEVGRSYYLARIEVPFEDAHLGNALSLVRPGMPVDVTLVTKSRTLAEYLIEPISESYSRAFVGN